MPSTENTIRENWLELAKASEPRKPLYHFALWQRGTKLDFYLERFFRGLDLTLHFFDDFESLMTTCQRYPVSVIIISGGDPLISEIELIQSIKANVFLSIIPVILYHPAPDYNDVVAAYENGVEDFIYGEWRDQLVRVRIGRVMERNRRDLSINPSSHLPGPAIIEREIDRLLKLKAEFAVAYADLDNFKAYNDYYGYYRGDKVIQLSSRIVKDVVFDLCREGFVGHIAGDDFIFVLPHDLVEKACVEIIRAFDTLIPYHYDLEDRERGSIMTKNRRGQEEIFELLTVSIAVLMNRDGEFDHVGEMSKMLADLKTAAKQKSGSNYLVERRKKY
ncbi:MAG: diguanylate cyclase [bacterium]